MVSSSPKDQFDSFDSSFVEIVRWHQTHIKVEKWKGKKSRDKKLLKCPCSNFEIVKIYVLVPFDSTDLAELFVQLSVATVSYSPRVQHAQEFEKYGKNSCFSKCCLIFLEIPVTNLKILVSLKTLATILPLDSTYQSEANK